MAASGWNLLVEHDGDPTSLISSIHRHVFESGQFQIPIVEPEVLEEMEFFEVSDEEREEMADHYGLRPVLAVAQRVGFEQFIPWCIERMENQQVDSLEGLRAMQCLSSSGTHSALDLHGISSAPEDFMLCPLTDDQIVRVFGKASVLLEDVSSMEMLVHGAIPSAYGRWQGVFVPTEDPVKHVYVEGASGD